VRKRCWGHSGVWRQKGPKAIGVNQGELFEEGAGVQAGRSAEEPERTAVRASILAKKRSNVRGAKGRRKVEA
jgi:hypothetical protein